MNLTLLAAGIGLLGSCPLIRPAIAAGQQTEGFPDVPKTHWAYEAVTDLKQRGILIGYPPERNSATPAVKQSGVRRTSARKPRIHRRLRK